MQLRKWRSSSASVNCVPEYLHEQEAVQELPTPNKLHKALNIHLDKCRDTLHVSTSSLKQFDELTKCNLTSDIARTFDGSLQQFFSCNCYCNDFGNFS